MGNQTRKQKVFDSKSYAEDITFGLCVNGYGAVVMIKPDYISLKNPKDYIRKTTNDTWISGILQTHKNGNIEYWEGFNLSEEEENAIWSILENMIQKVVQIVEVEKILQEILFKGEWLI